MNSCTELGLTQCKACALDHVCLIVWYQMELTKMTGTKNFIGLVKFVQSSLPHEMIYFIEAVKLHPKYEKLLVLL